MLRPRRWPRSACRSASTSRSASWIGEKLSRVKLNGHLLSRSPLSDLVEFEFIATAVLAKRAGFETLRALAAVDSRLDADALDRMIAQADKQHDWLADVRREVAARVFGGRPERPTRPRTADRRSPGGTARRR